MNDSLLTYAARLGAECEVWTSRRSTRQRTYLGGSRERSIQTENSITAVTVWRDGHEGCAVVQGGDAPPGTVDDALAVATVLPPRENSRPATWGSSAHTEPGTIDWSGVEDLPHDGETELTVTVESAHLTLVRTGFEPIERTASTATVAARVGARGENLAYLARNYAARDLRAAVELASRGLPEALRIADALSGPIGSWTTPPVLLIDASVVARLLALLAPSLQWDAVHQGRSRLAGRLGESMAPGALCLSDDPTGLGLPFDDTGTPTGRTPLVLDGELRGFLGDGAKWRPDDGGTPVIRPSALTLHWDAPGAHDQPYVEVTHANGMHISNEVTGDFSFAAAGLAEGRNTGTFTVAGNVITLLNGIVGTSGPSSPVRVGATVYSTPALLVAGLTVGR